MTLLFRNLDLPEHARPLARLISDYDHYLSLEKLPPGHPFLIDHPEKPYAVIHRHPGLPEYVVESFREDWLDQRVMATILQGDAEKHGWVMEDFDPLGAAAMLLEARRREDEFEEAQDRMNYKLAKRSGHGKMVL